MLKVAGWIKLFVRGWLKFAAYVAVFWAAFRFIFDFSNRQAVGLGLVIAIAIDLAASRKCGRPEFWPYVIGIYPHVGRMLVDIGLVTEHQFHAATKDKPPFRPWTDQHLFHYEIRAWVIGWDPDTQRDLIHFANIGIYTTRLELDFPIEQFRQGDRWPGIGWTPEFFFRPSANGGYAFGLRVGEKWWKENKANVAAGLVLHEDHEYNFGQVRLTLAILPAQVFRAFYVRQAADHQDRLKEIVGERGWTQERRGGGEIPSYGESYDHKYVHVWIDSIDD